MSCEHCPHCQKHPAALLPYDVVERLPDFMDEIPGNPFMVDTVDGLVRTLRGALNHQQKLREEESDEMQSEREHCPRCQKHPAALLPYDVVERLPDFMSEIPGNPFMVDTVDGLVRTLRGALNHEQKLREEESDEIQSRLHALENAYADLADERAAVGRENERLRRDLRRAEGEREASHMEPPYTGPRESAYAKLMKLDE